MGCFAPAVAPDAPLVAPMPGAAHTLDLREEAAELHGLCRPVERHRADPAEF
jgi:hypothetical protein